MSYKKSISLNMFKELLVDTKIIQGIESPNNDQAEKITNNLIDFYKQFDIYQTYSPKQIDYVSRLSVNFALWNMPVYLRQDNIIEAYAYWLSVIWLVDSVFDVAKDKDMSKLKDIITELIEKSINYKNVNMDDYEIKFDKKMSKHDQIMKQLPVVVYQTFNKYNSMIKSYRNNNTESFDMINYWLYKFLDNLIEKEEDKNIKELDTYYNWRLIDGLMMSVPWHLMLFMNIPANKIEDKHKELFKLASILVAYHNDILSYHRDVAQNVNNLAKCLMYQKYSIDYKIASYQDIKYGIINTIEYVDQLYKKSYQLYTEFSQLYPDDKDFMAIIFLSVVVGSYNWANIEEKYKKGRIMIDTIKNKDDQTFNQLFDLYDIVAGDPIL